MNVTILCSDPAHPVNERLQKWVQRRQKDHRIALVRSKKELSGGDILFLVSCSEIISAQERALYGASLVMHASALPLGRGWSPHVWQILAGATEITLSLLEAADKVDSGRIWRQSTFPVPPHALWDEINDRLFEAELSLMDAALQDYGSIAPEEQAPHLTPTYYPKRTPEDSRIDPDKTLASQFNLIRVCDPQRFPAFFSLHGHKYKITLEKIHD